MQVRSKMLKRFEILLLLAIISALAIPVLVRAGDETNGRKLAISQPVGNCVACHVLPDVDLPGDVGPNLIESMNGYTEKDRATVRQWVWDPTTFNPDTIMPPYGKNKLLTEKEIDDIVEYLYSLRKGN